VELKGICFVETEKGGVKVHSLSAQPSQDQRKLGKKGSPEPDECKKAQGSELLSADPKKRDRVCGDQGGEYFKLRAKSAVRKATYCPKSIKNKTKNSHLKTSKERKGSPAWKNIEGGQAGLTGTQPIYRSFKGRQGRQ